MTHHSTTSPAPADAHELRRRAGHLTEFASSIERSLVMTLAEHLGGSGSGSRRERLCEALLERNLHQLHRAADELRVTALRFRARADELEAALGPAA